MKQEQFVPHPYQLRGIEFLINGGFGKGKGLWWSMGLGKTVAVLSALDYWLDNFLIRKVLIVGPKRVVQHAWPREIEHWEHTAWMRYNVLCGTQKERETAATDTSAQIHLVNYESFRWLLRFWSKRRKWPYDVVVFDESTKMKAPGTQRFAAARALIKSGRVKCTICLTGEPAENQLLDLWAQTYLLDSGEALGRTYEIFKNRWFQPGENGYSLEPREGAATEIGQRVQHLYLTMRGRDYLQLPELIDNVIPLDIPAYARKLYLKIEKELYAVLASGAAISAANRAVAQGKARQAVNGALYLDESGRFEEIHTAKLDALDELVEEVSTPLLVGIALRSDRARILERFPFARVLDQNPSTIDEWNAGNIRMLLLNPASDGYGLNLQGGPCRDVVHFALPWNWGKYNQFVARVWRQGVRNSIRNHILMVQNSVDEYVWLRLHQKREHQEQVLNSADRGLFLPESVGTDPSIDQGIWEALRTKYGSRAQG